MRYAKCDEFTPICNTPHLGYSYTLTPPRTALFSKSQQNTSEPLHVRD